MLAMIPKDHSAAAFSRKTASPNQRLRFISTGLLFRINETSKYSKMISGGNESSQSILRSFSFTSNDAQAIFTSPDAAGHKQTQTTLSVTEQKAREHRPMSGEISTPLLVLMQNEA